MKKRITMQLTILLLLISGIGGTMSAQNSVTTFSDPTRIFDLPDDKTIDPNIGNKENLDISGVSTREGECDLTQSFHQNGGIAPGDFRTTAVGLAGRFGILCTIQQSNLGYARLFNLTANGIPANSDFVITSVDYVLQFNSPVVPVTVSVYSYPAGTTVPTMASGTLLASEIMTQPESSTITLYTHPISATVPAGEMVLVTVEAVSGFGGGAFLSHEGGPFGGVPELAPTYVFGCPTIPDPFTDYTDVDEFFVNASVMFQLNGDTDADCDGVGDLCDLCPGGDDSGPCDATSLPPISELPDNYLCSNNGNSVKVKVCHNGNTLCVSENAVQAHLNHGDFLGPCASCTGTNEATSNNNNIDLVNQFELKIFPNPASDRLTVQVSGTTFNTQLKLYDIYGNTLWNQEVVAGQTSVEVDISQSKFGTGIYFISASNEKGTQFQRLMITK